MAYSSKDIAYLQERHDALPSLHLKALLEMVQRNAPYGEVFAYGISFLPKLRTQDGRIDLEKLNGYVPEIVEFFDVLSEVPSLPKELTDLATDFAIYANGESVQADRDYYRLDPEAALKSALRAIRN